MRTEIEEGMGFAGHAPSAEERRAEAYVNGLNRRIRELENTLRGYVHCRHACIDCFCTKEARAVLHVPTPAEPK